MKRVLFAMLVLVTGFAHGEAVNHAPTTPPNAEIVRFPHIAEVAIPQTARQQWTLEARLGLRPVVLRTPLAAWNHYRHDSSWRYETISRGAVVLVDEEGIIRYKADCWNRLVVIQPWYTEVLDWINTIWHNTVVHVTGFVTEHPYATALIALLLLSHFVRRE